MTKQRTNLRKRMIFDQIYVFKNFEVIATAQRKYGFDADDVSTFADHLFQVPVSVNGVDEYLPAIKVRRSTFMPQQSSMPAWWALAACVVLQLDEKGNFIPVKLNRDWPAIKGHKDEVIANAIDLAEGRTAYAKHFVDMQMEQRTDYQAQAAFCEQFAKWELPALEGVTPEDTAIVEQIAALSGWVLTQEMRNEIMMSKGVTVTEIARYFRSLRRHNVPGYSFTVIAAYMNDELQLGMKVDDLTFDHMADFRWGEPMATDVRDWAREFNRPDVEPLLAEERVNPAAIIQALATPIPFVHDHVRDRKIPNAFVAQSVADGHWYVLVETKENTRYENKGLLLPATLGMFCSHGRRMRVNIPHSISAIRCFGEADAYQRLAEFYARQLENAQ